MKSLILVTTARLLKPLLLLVSVIVLLRGHDAPGGGFVGGLLAASAFAFDGLIDPRFRRAPHLPHKLLGAGLLLAITSGLPAVLAGLPFLTAQVYDLALPFGLHLELGTVLLFDLGVYVTVLAAALLIITTLEELPS